MFVISTPTISSPLTADFPILDLKKLVTFFESSLVLSDGFETELFSKKLGFLNLIFFILSKKANFDFLFSCSSSGDWFKIGASILGSVNVVVWLVCSLLSQKIWQEH